MIDKRYKKKILKYNMRQIVGEKLGGEKERERE